MRGSRDAVRRTAVLLALVLAVLTGTAAPAAAHASLLQTTPADGVVLPDAPREVVLRFSEAVGTSLGTVRVLAPDGSRADTGEVETRADGREVVALLRTSLRQGTYLLLWRVVSEDGHPVSGSSIFSVGRTSDVAAADTSSGGSGARRVLGVSRFVAFAGLVVLIGCVFFLLAVDRLRERGEQLLAVVGWSGAAAAVGTAVAFLVQGPYGAGESLAASLRPSLLRAVAGTRFGVATATRLVLVVVLAVALHAWVRRDRTWARAVAIACAAAAAVATSLAGHAGVGDLTWLAVPLDSVHLLAAGAWAGGLVLLATVVLRRADDTVDLRRALPRWSRLAATAVAVLIATGAFASWREVQELPALPRTSYGRLLIGKTELVLGMLVLAMVGRAWVQRHAAVADAPVARLRRSVAWEAGVAAVVLAVTAALVETTPARSAYSPTFVARDRVIDLQVEVRVAPARAGLNEVVVEVDDAGGAPADVAEVTARFTHTHGEGHDAAAPTEVSVTVPRERLGRYTQPRLVLPMPGTWRLEMVVRTSEIDATTLIFTVPVR